LFALFIFWKNDQDSRSMEKLLRNYYKYNLASWATVTFKLEAFCLIML